MLTIRDSQLRALALSDALVRQVVDHLRAHLPDRIAHWSDQEAMTHARTALRLAYSYGLSSRRDLFRFVNLTVFAGLRWWRDPETSWMHRAMRDVTLGTPSQRLQQVFDRYLAELDS